MKDLTKSESLHILETNYIGYLSFIWENKPYSIPITYYYNKEDNCIISYSDEGHKIDAMRLNNATSLAITEIESINKWKSILVHGKFEELDGTFAQHQLHKFTLGLKKIIANKDHEYPQFINDFPNKTKSYKAPVVYRIKILDLSGKSS
ncbi:MULTISPECIES: pyridoxamine 5'-phosphate oxidase family protein [unclassified Algibacter]|uniref:pyridoxamine 5'-phosphate oxidase family protein n=1 Tax=unclassified Algibacter TaxID=2615009 RepID=UPI00131D979E|nr:MULTISPECIES: pyridoxamine 5'-phosphate oxidase family protein [unclassified Algibacter]MCL5128280.1 pyridoxamine 5'-phosphate oxidase family protein [Algibacter sp. L4_22]